MGARGGPRGGAGGRGGGAGGGRGRRRFARFDLAFRTGRRLVGVLRGGDAALTPGRRCAGAAFAAESAEAVEIVAPPGGAGSDPRGVAALLPDPAMPAERVFGPVRLWSGAAPPAP